MIRVRWAQSLGPVVARADLKFGAKRYCTTSHSLASKPKWHPDFPLASLSLFKPLQILRSGAHFFSASEAPNCLISPCVPRIRRTSPIMPIVYSRKRLRALQPSDPLDAQPEKLSETLPTAVKPRKRTPTRAAKRRRYIQLHLDAGQSLIRTCPECSMTYSPGPDDDTHARHHSLYLRRQQIRWNSTEDIVCTHNNGVIITVRPPQWRKLSRVDMRIREILGMNDNDIGSAGTWMAVMYVKKGVVHGYVLVERVEYAERASVEKDGVVSVEGDTKDVVMGVRRIWVDSSMRRQGVASAMMDVARVTFFYGSVVAKDMVAFSPTTPDGALFATKWCTTLCIYRRNEE